MYEKKIIVSGPVILRDNNLLVIRDSKDNFYKIPGGTVEEFDRGDLEATCKREFKEETNGELEILKELSPLVLYKNPTTFDKMRIELHHYLARLLNEENLKPISPIQEVKWLSLKKIKQGQYSVAPNILFLIKKGDI